jgi:hypothetical protein
VVATLALVAAVGGGTAWAAGKVRTRNIGYHAVTASKINYNAITASKVKNGSLSGKEVRDNSIRTNDVRNGSLKAEDFGAGQLPQGDKGDKGDPATSIFGTVAADGTLGNNRGVTATSGAPGVYTATVNQDVSKCAVVATLSIGTAAGFIAAQPNPASAQQVTIETRNFAGAAEPRPFSFAVHC